MSRSRYLPHRSPRPWTYALVGGLASIPLTVGLYWLSGTEHEFPIVMVIFGGLLAGFLARRDAAEVRTAGIGAGVIGGLPAFGWILPALLGTAGDFAAAWSSPPVAVVFAIVFSVTLLGLCALAGLLGGVVGGWLATLVHGHRSRAVGN